MSIRKAFVMNVYPEKIEEYRKRHNPIWRELEETLRDHGVCNYSIFLNEQTHELFGYVELESEKLWNDIAKTAICQKWWSFMEELMETNIDKSPVSKELKEIFHLY